MPGAAIDYNAEIGHVRAKEIIDEKQVISQLIISAVYLLSGIVLAPAPMHLAVGFMLALRTLMATVKSGPSPTRS
jgi:hypothetical protein